MANLQNLRRKGTKLKKYSDINIIMSEHVHEPAGIFIQLMQIK